MAKAEIDWDKIEEENKREYKNYAEVGTYKVKVIGTSIRDVDTQSGVQHIIKFDIAETDDTKYPGIDRWVFKNNVSFRQYHYRNLFMVLGCSKDGAKAAVEECEGAGGYDAIAEKYAKTLGQVANKYKREIEIEVRPQVDRNGEYVINAKSGKPYTESEFVDQSVHFAATKAKQSNDSPLDIKPEEIMDDADTIDPSDIPF